MVDSAAPAHLNAALEGRYRIERQLGEGGMATVYLAEDLKHDRKVAIKVLRPELAAVVGSERFLAEIRTTANLQHPHILPLFDSGQDEGVLWYAMPYVEGESLRDRLDREKQLPVDEAVGIALKVAGALSAAHDAGIVHRDIKPANILIDAQGEPLVADFGIALAVQQAGGGRLTETGLSLGTPYYMSPEQATGDREPDARSDVYSLGCVLYEMLAGEPPFQGNTAQAVLGRIITGEVTSPSELRKAVPPNVAGAVLKALEKLPADRFESVREFAAAIRDRSFRYGDAGGAGSDGATARMWRARAILSMVVAVVCLGMALWVAGSPVDEAEVPMVLTMDFGDLEIRGDVKISSDGRSFAVSAAGADGEFRIWVRGIDEPDFRPLAGTESGNQPDFSPGGDWIVYRETGSAALRRIPTGGGGVETVLDHPDYDPLLPVWGPDGEIAFRDRSGGAYVVPEGGSGSPRLLTPSGTVNDFLPDGRSVLGSVADQVFFMDFEADTLVRLMSGASPRYLETGHILYRALTGGAFVVAFDADAGTVHGVPVPVRSDVQPQFLSAGYDVSADGTLVFRRGVARDGSTPNRRLVRADRGGVRDTLPLTPRFIDNLKASPDGRWVVFGAGRSGGTTDGTRLQLFNLVTGSSPDLTPEGTTRVFDPAWSHDSERILYGAAGDSAGLYVVRADRSGPPTLVLAAGEASLYPGSWGADGLAVVNRRVGSNGDLWYFDPDDGSSGGAPFLDAAYPEQWPIRSPDGAHVAYESDETGLREVYVRDFPTPTEKWAVSEGGGHGVRWSPTGDELYYWQSSSTGIDSLFSVPIRREPEFQPGEPEFLFDLRRSTRPRSGDNWDVHPEGWFVIAVDEGSESRAASEPRITVIVNWFDQIEARLDAGGGR